MILSPICYVKFKLEAYAYFDIKWWKSQYLSFERQHGNSSLKDMFAFSFGNFLTWLWSKWALCAFVFLCVCTSVTFMLVYFWKAMRLYLNIEFFSVWSTLLSSVYNGKKRSQICGLLFTDNECMWWSSEFFFFVFLSK